MLRRSWGMLVFVLLLSCGGGPDSDGGPVPTVANPASVFCVEQGGGLDIRDDSSGAQIGMCVFADGSECEEWAYYRGDCTPGGDVP